jgi:hypothetical protein
MKRVWIVGGIALVTLAGFAGYRQNESEKTQRLRMQVQPMGGSMPRPEQTANAALSDVVKANNALAVDLYDRLRSEPGNVLFAPAALSAALALLRAGARGGTADEMDRVLRRTGAFKDQQLVLVHREMEKPVS